MKERDKNFLEVDSKQLEKNKNNEELVARRRIGLLLDPNSFFEIGKYNGYGNSDDSKNTSDSVITGYGTVNERLVFLYSQNPEFKNGAFGEKQSIKIDKIQKMALSMGAPIIEILDSKGSKIDEGMNIIESYGKLIDNKIKSSGVIPQISVVVGSCYGISSLLPNLSDFVFMVDGKSEIFLNSPQVINSIENKTFDNSTLGGSKVHSEESGLSNFVSSTEDELFESVKELLDFLPSNNLENSLLGDNTDNINRQDEALRDIIPEASFEKYDIKEIIENISDDNIFFEISQKYSQNIITGFIRLNGQTIGIIANNPSIEYGQLDSKGTRKIVSFINKCDSFNIPLLTLVDTPGYKGSSKEEQFNISKEISKLLAAYSNASVPKISVILRKAYGNGYLVMGTKILGADLVFALPSSEISLLSPEGMINIIKESSIKSSEDPSSQRDKEIEKYIASEASPYEAAAKGYVDIIIDPLELRPRLIYSYDMLSTKRTKNIAKKHDNI